MTWTYLLLDLGSILMPVLFIADKRIRILTNLKALGVALMAGALVFIPWDVWFTRQGYWSFNPSYVIGVNLFGLPVEEWLFFLAIPYCMIFVWEVLHHYFPTPVSLATERLITIMLLFISAIFCLMNTAHPYSCVVAAGLFVSIIGFRKWAGSAAMAGVYFLYPFHLIGFWTVNGVLTSLPVVIYHPDAITGIRLGTIPVEDHLYSLLILMVCVGTYIRLRRPSVD
ncbi:MAG: lycopene cyclase domain-containing protein [Flavobacteriales bacterium]|nr:lycopene cyclase domain-containing protein [Flavobacteriales bacterium]MCB9448567.1 lycopene cyclase domain-containing protein [Flavobacteriales bacterium]